MPRPHPPEFRARAVELARVLQRQVEQLQAHSRELEESLTAARATNRELMARLNTMSCHQL